MNWTYTDQESWMLLSYSIHLSEIFITNGTMKVAVAVAVAVAVVVVVVVVVVVGGGGEEGEGEGGERGVVLGTFCLLF